MFQVHQKSGRRLSESEPIYLPFHVFAQGINSLHRSERAIYCRRQSWETTGSRHVRRETPRRPPLWPRSWPLAPSWWWCPASTTPPRRSTTRSSTPSRSTLPCKRSLQFFCVETDVAWQETMGVQVIVAPRRSPARTLSRPSSDRNAVTSLPRVRASP